MQVSIYPSTVSGEISAPSSKSGTQRAFAAALIRRGTSIIKNAGKSNDEQAALNVIRTIGAGVEENEREIKITGEDVIFTGGSDRSLLEINCGESGLGMRMFAGIASLFDREVKMTGEGSILTRPMNFVEEYLPRLGVEVKTNGGKVPLFIKGPLQPKLLTVDGSLSSQFITGLLFAFCRAATEPVEIKVKNLTSRPYIDLTLDVLKKFGFRVENKEYESFKVYPAKTDIGELISYRVEGDWSNAAFILVAAAVASDNPVFVKGMDIDSTQGDKRIMEALQDAGADITYRDDGDIEIKSNFHLRGFRFDATQCPDLFPPLVALAANCKGESIIAGVHRLYHKESDRAKALKEEFEKMNVAVRIDDDNMIVSGSDEIKGAVVSSHNDHRIAMATAVAALNGRGKTTIQDAEAINKSYPGFYNDLQKLGVFLVSSPEAEN